MTAGRRPKVLLLGKLPPPHIGPAVATRILLGSALRERFRLVHVDTSDHRDIRTLARIDLKNLALAARHYAVFGWRLIRFRPDIVYLPSQQTTLGYARDLPYFALTKLLGKRIVFHLRGGHFRSWYDSSSPFVRAIVRVVQKRLDAQIVLGERLRSMFLGLMPEERIRVVPNGGDFAFPARTAHPGKVRILFISNFVRSKGVLDVLGAVPEVFSSEPSAEFSFAGSWHDAATEAEFRRFLRERPGLPVRELGPVDGESKLRLLADADIFVFPTYYPYEGQPWVLVEAMAAGLPIVATDHAAIGESVIEGRNGFLVAKRSPDRIAEKVVRLARDPELRRTMGRESRAIYESRLTEAAMIDGLTDVFRSVAEG